MRCKRLKNRVLITGGTRGIGEACVRLFSELGYRVAFIYKNSEEQADLLERECGAKAIRADISDSAAVKNAVEMACDALGGVDVLVNNAGVASVSLFDEISDAEWDRVIDTNLSGTFYASREVSRLMIRQKYGRIINIGSVWGRCGASCEVHYSASKAGIRGLTLALAKELGPSGITVNCVEPGVIETDMNACHSEETMHELADDTPVCRIGTSYDVARAVAFLADEGSSFITGQCLGVDGGFAL